VEKDLDVPLHELFQVPAVTRIEKKPEINPKSLTGFEPKAVRGQVESATVIAWPPRPHILSLFDKCYKLTLCECKQYLLQTCAVYINRT
jgi:hypothetical protein